MHAEYWLISGALIGAVAAILIQFIWGGSKDLDTLRKEALMFVAAAEKLLPGATGEEKLNYVMNALRELGLFRGLDERVIRAAVEWAVGVWKEKMPAAMKILKEVEMPHQNLFDEHLGVHAVVGE